MTALLEFRGLDAYYGRAHILHGLSFAVQPGERVALIGRNGVGKTTCVNAMLGVASSNSNSIYFGGKAFNRVAAHHAAMAGIGIVPQGRRILPNLSIQENLVLGTATGRKGPWDLERVYQLFPVLHERRANPGMALSGGQQQMLAIGRALMSNPSLLVLDEPSEGLAPIIVDELAEVFGKLADDGTALLLIEQNLGLIERVARRLYVMEKGTIVDQGEVGTMSTETIRSYLAV